MAVSGSSLAFLIVISSGFCSDSSVSTNQTVTYKLSHLTFWTDSIEDLV